MNLIDHKILWALDHRSGAEECYYSGGLMIRQSEKGTLG